MNRTKIEWCDYTYNPITGCSRRCEHCYAWAMAKRLRGRFGYPADDPFRPTFHADKVLEPFWLNPKKHFRIFVCSMGELFDPAVTQEWREPIWNVIRGNREHTFIILTQCSEALSSQDFPPNCWVGVTVKYRTELSRLDDLRQSNARVKFVSFEPLLESVIRLIKPVEHWLEGINWVIVGAMTGPKPFSPPPEWVIPIIHTARYFGCALFLKDNLAWPVKIQEFPGGL